MYLSESFESLAQGLRNALHELGGVPGTHHVDRMPAAVSNMSGEKALTQRYAGLLDHYAKEGRNSRADKAQENGDIEQRHHRFIRALEEEFC